MFASKDLFSDSADIDVDAPPSRSSQPPRSTFNSSTLSGSPESSPRSSPAPSHSSQRDDAQQTPTPAMRKQKMEEMKKAQLDKRKQKAMAAPTILRANADSLKSSPAPSSSPTHATPKSSFASAASSGGSALNFCSKDGDSDDEPVGLSPIVDYSADASIHALLAEKAYERDAKNISAVERNLMAAGIAPVYDPIKKISAGVKLDFSDMRNFLTQPVPRGMVFQCYIIRNKKGLKNKMYPSYELYHEEGDRFLLNAKKRSQNKTSNYLISMDKASLGSKESASYLGKVRSNFVGTEFVAYDKGINPKELDDESAAISMMTVRQELCAVFYESNILGSRGPRKMTAVIPSIKKDGSRTILRPLKPDDSILTKFKSSPQHPDFMALQNKTPKWNEQVGAYVLNFNGRVTMASVKNFQLIHIDDPENVLLQFGRVGKDNFTMDCAYPLSPLQAFAICLSSFDYKFACE